MGLGMVGEMPKSELANNGCLFWLTNDTDQGADFSSSPMWALLIQLRAS